MTQPADPSSVKPGLDVRALFRIIELTRNTNQAQVDALRKRHLSVLYEGLTEGRPPADPAPQPRPEPAPAEPPAAAAAAPAEAPPPAPAASSAAPPAAPLPAAEELTDELFQTMQAETRKLARQTAAVNAMALQMLNKRLFDRLQHMMVAGAARRPPAAGG